MELTGISFDLIYIEQFLWLFHIFLEEEGAFPLLGPSVQHIYTEFALLTLYLLRAI